MRDDPLLIRLVAHRPHPDGLVEAVADLDGGGLLDDARDEVVVELVVLTDDDGVRGGEAALAGVAEERGHLAGGRGIRLGLTTGRAA